MLSAGLVEIHLAWAEQDQAPRRACVLCQHSRACARECGHPATQGLPSPISTDRARARDGICGPNAALMSSAGLG